MPSDHFSCNTGCSCIMESFFSIHIGLLFIDWRASLPEPMRLLVIWQQAPSPFVVIFSNTFSCIIISSELERCHSNTCLLLMKRYDTPIQIFHAACTEELVPPLAPCTLNTWNTTVSFNYEKMRWDFASLQEQGLTCEAVTDWTPRVTQLMVDSTTCLVEQPPPCRSLDHNSTTSRFYNDRNLTIIHQVNIMF